MISSKWSKNSMHFTLGMPFLGVLGKFYRNRKGLTMTTYEALPVHPFSCYQNLSGLLALVCDYTPTPYDKVFSGCCSHLASC